jgi:crotonobetainyl-CoA:carnitine CoA-transferase CaiB-like acyl-CoA transferase
MSSLLPFQGIKVVELASILAGPLVGSFFAELGANVIKIENKRSNGEPTRGWLHQNESLSVESDYFTAANFDKEILLLDFTDEAEYNKLLKIIEDADIVIANFLPSISKKLKCTFADFNKLNDRLIYVNLVAYDENDDRPGFDLLMQAECGYLSMTGSANEIAKMPTAMIDILAAHQMKEAILIALYQQAKGEINSCELSVSLFKSGLTGLINQGSSYINSGIVAQRLGTLHPSIAPYGDIFYSIERTPFVLAVGTDHQFEKLNNAFNLGLLEEFSKNKDRVIQRTTLTSLINQCFGTLQMDKISSILNTIGVPYSPIKTIKEALDTECSKSMIVTKKNGKKRISDIAFKSVES